MKNSEQMSSNELFYNVLKDFRDRGSCEPLSEVLEYKTLMPDQQLSVLFSLLKKKLILSNDTGLGKTVIASVLVNMLLPNGKGLFILKRETLDEIYDKKLSMDIKPSLEMTYITNQDDVKKYMLNSGKLDTSDLIVISSDAISDVNINDYLYSIKDKLKLVIVDEAHLFSNLQSVESRLMSYLIEHSEYSVMLTATPFEREIQQLINTAYVLNPNILQGKTPRYIGNLFRKYENGEMVGYKNLDKLKKLISPIMLVITTDMLGIKRDIACKIHTVLPKKEWINLAGAEAIIAIKGDKEGEPFYKLLNILNHYREENKKGIIYANYNVTKKMLVDELPKLGYKVGIVDGSICDKKMIEQTKEMLVNGEIDVLITNKVTSADLECDFIIFYEFTLSYVQMRGRPARGYKDKSYSIDFIVCKGTYDEKFLRKNVINRAEIFSYLTGKNVSELTGALKEIK